MQAAKLAREGGSAEDGKAREEEAGAKGEGEREVIDLRFRQCESPYRKGMTYTKAHPFSANYAKTLDLLESELKHLGAKEIVIQAGFTAQQIRNDGWPRGGENPKLHQGVILSFQTKRGPLSFPCYRYGNWQANLRAIALSLEALRAVDRYGVTQQAEQYKGWTQIEAPKDGFVDRLAAALFVADQSGASDVDQDVLANRILQSAEARQAAYLRAAKALHPDVGGKQEDFVRLQKAMELLRQQTARAS
jgi:hypothetical protein